MLGTYIHRIDPVLLDVAGVHLWWYGLGFAIGFLELHLFLRRPREELRLSPREVWSLSLFIAWFPVSTSSAGDPGTTSGSRCPSVSEVPMGPIRRTPG